jgi:phosphoglycerate dehydrogenase-like enzyme
MRIAVLDDYQGVALKMADWSRLKAAHEVVVLRKAFSGPEEVVRALGDFEVICAMRERTPFPRSVIERLPKLKLLVTTGHRNAAIDLKAAAERGIVVCGTPSSGHAAFELSFALLMCVARQVHVQHQSMRDGGWQVGVGGDLNGRTLGIIGLGKIGSQMAKLGRAFGMNIIAWSQNLTDERAKECGAAKVEKARLFAEADYVTIHVALSERTRGLISAAELNAMKPTAYLINTSRGPIVEEKALISALEAGRIAGAALDVYDVEPLPVDHVLRKMPRVLLTPHVGYVSEANYRGFYGGTVENIEAWLAGKPINQLKA